MTATKTDFSVGQRVYFGRTNGEKTLGKIVKMNPAKAKVETLEQRGHGRGAEVGKVWGVPYSMMTPAETDEGATCPKCDQRGGLVLKKDASINYEIPSSGDIDWDGFGTGDVTRFDESIADRSGLFSFSPQPGDQKMKTTIFTIRADYEHNADIFWTELGQAYPDVADQLRAGAGSATVDLWTWNAIQKLEGFSDGPDYAPAALVVAETNPLSESKSNEQQTPKDCRCKMRVSYDRNDICERISRQILNMDGKELIEFCQANFGGENHSYDEPNDFVLFEVDNGEDDTHK